MSKSKIKEVTPVARELMNYIMSTRGVNATKLIRGVTAKFVDAPQEERLEIAKLMVEVQEVIPMELGTLKDWQRRLKLIPNLNQKILAKAIRYILVNKLMVS